MRVLPKDVQDAINRQLPNLVKREFDSVFDQKFKQIKNEMIQEFLTHPVTLEIKSGPSGFNISGTLGGVSNLFAFIGFPEGSDPINPILDILEKIEYKDNEQSKSGGWIYTVIMPKSADIFAQTPMPWAEGRSWARGIESGISGLGHLINRDSGSSRSGAALQVKNKIRGGKYKPTAYISRLINKYNKQFSKLR